MKMLEKFEHSYTFSEYKRIALNTCLDFLDDHSKEKRSEIKNKLKEAKSYRDVDKIRDKIEREAIDNYKD